MILTFFQKNSRGIFLVLSGFLGLGLGTFCAALLGTFLQSDPVRTSAAPSKARQPIRQTALKDYQDVLARDIFNSDGGKLTFAPTTPRRSRAGAAPAKASNWQLIGTISGGPLPLATLRNDDETRAYRLNSELPDGSTLSRVERNQVTLARPDGSELQLVLPTEGSRGSSVNKTAARSSRATRSKRRPSSVTGIRSLGENRWQITSSAAEQARGNIGELLKQARVEPNVVNGKTNGFMVKMIRPSSLLSQLGLQVGDVLHEINDVPLDSPEKALQIFQQLRQARQVNIALERNGAPLTFSYEID